MYETKIGLLLSHTLLSHYARILITILYTYGRKLDSLLDLIFLSRYIA